MDNMKYINSHSTNKEVFEDSMKWIKENPKLLESVEASVSKQFMWKEEDSVCPLKTSAVINNGQQLQIVVSGKRTYEASEPYAKAGKKVAVLNFANNHNAGGGVVWGANAQEECLCRCSTLYPCIAVPQMKKDFYEYHTKRFLNRELDETANDDLIYTPDVVVFKTDAPIPERMEEKDWYTVDVITCAAPDLDDIYNFDKNKLYNIHLKRWSRILESARLSGAQVVILGAFGCGAFHNDPEVVAKAAKDAIKNFETAFETVEFAVFATARDKKNLTAFEKELKD